MVRFAQVRQPRKSGLPNLPKLVKGNRFWTIDWRFWAGWPHGWAYSARSKTHSRIVPSRPSDVKILRLRMVNDDGVGGLLGGEHVVLGQLDADLLRTQQLDDLFPLRQIGTGRIAEGVAAAAIALLEQLADAGG